MFLTRRNSSDLFDLFREFDGQFSQLSGETSRVSWYPAVESFTRDGQLHLRMELPGVEPEKVDVTVTEGRLTISGEKGYEKDLERADVHLREIARGRFSRTFALPEGVNADGIKARHVNGVLEIGIPVEVASSSTRRIPVQTEAKGFFKKSA